MSGLVTEGPVIFNVNGMDAFISREKTSQPVINVGVSDLVPES